MTPSMIENIARYIEEGESPMAAALKGAADRLHHHLADRVADRRADPAAVHGRRGRTAVPRVRHLAGHHDLDFGGGLADAGADDVGPLAQAAQRRETDRLRPPLPAVLRLGHRPLRHLADLGLE